MAILRAAKRRLSGAREWHIPGAAPNTVRLSPANYGYWPAPSFTWPHLKDDGEWIERSVRLDWHRSIAKKAALDMIYLVEVDAAHNSHEVLL